jgi:hypothetical protein
MQFDSLDENEKERTKDKSKKGLKRKRWKGKQERKKERNRERVQIERENWHLPRTQLAFLSLYRVYAYLYLCAFFFLLFFGKTNS